MFTDEVFIFLNKWKCKIKKKDGIVHVEQILGASKTRVMLFVCLHRKSKGGLDKNWIRSHDI